MPSVEEIADEIITGEGGFVDDPDDPGGATKWGVTIHTLRRLGVDLDGDGQVTRGDVQRLSRRKAREIFVREYFEGPGLGRLPALLHATVFDMQVNAGREAVRLLQRLVTRMGFPAAEDGIIGPVTVSAVRRAAEAAPHHIADAYGIERRSYFYRLADQRPTSRKYARRRDGGKGGWITRAEAFISPKYHLTEAQHRERVRAWG
ncbi:MAG: holin-associated N-acetylmuramidase [Paracoccaceae bacterium]|nr:holin-associated N-acetylmuramidase [Paracoccaceae bacterium]